MIVVILGDAFLISVVLHLIDRIELLSMVRKHSNLLGEAVVDEQDDSDIGMDARFWHEMLDLYFIRGRVSKGKEEDDLIFFVRNMVLYDEVPPSFGLCSDKVYFVQNFC